MAKSIFDEINQINNPLFTQDFSKRCACVLRRNYYALETSSIKESFDSDVFDLYSDSKYDSIKRPNSKTRRISDFALGESKDDSLTSSNNLDSFDSVISNPEFQSLKENPINNKTTIQCPSEQSSKANNIKNKMKLRFPDKNNNITSSSKSSNDDDDSIDRGLSFIKKYQGQNALNSIEEIRQVQKKVKEINDLDYNVNSLIFKAVEVHTDILVSC